MTIRMVSVTPISISVPSFFLSHSGGMPVCTIITESTCPIFVEPTDFLSFYPYVFAAMVHCVTGSDSTLLKIQQIIIQLGMDPRPNTIGLVFIHPTSVKGFPSGYFFGGALGKQDCEGTTIISILLLCATRLHVAGI